MVERVTDAHVQLIRRAFSRRDLLKLSGAVLAGAALAGAAGCSSDSGGSGDKTLTVGNIGWDENVALANLTKVILEEDLGYKEVKIEARDVGALFKGVANGELDTFQDVWLPKTHKAYWDQYKDQMVRLDSWYTGDVSLGLAVPDYVEAETIEDLRKYPSRFGGKIVGIEPGAGEMRIVKEEVMPGYNLSDYELIEGTTPKMLAALEDALNRQEPIVVTLWQPHWAFTVFAIRYLDDPKQLISGGEDEAYSVVRNGLKEDLPDAYAFLNAISLGADQIGQLELAINLANTPVEGVKKWLDADRPFGSRKGLNRDIVQPWIDAAKRAGKQKA